MNRLIEVLDDAGALALAGADEVERLLAASSGRFSLALAGGSTPRRLYQVLAGRSLPGHRLEVFLGDERCVPWDHPDSNHRMVRETLLQGRSLSLEQVHPWSTNLPPMQAAEEYGELIERVLDKPLPAFDLVLLGLGEDGHTASLFPGSPALEVLDRATAANAPEGGRDWRLTFTFPLLNRARRVLFLVSGAAKAPALARVLAGGDLPAARVRGTEETLFLVDREAAGRE